MKPQKSWLTEEREGNEELVNDPDSLQFCYRLEGAGLVPVYRRACRARGGFLQEKTKLGTVVRRGEDEPRYFGCYVCNCPRRAQRGTKLLLQKSGKGEAQMTLSFEQI